MSRRVVPVSARRSGSAKDVPVLESGDHLDQPEFHRRYERMPPHVKAELIGGIVFMPSPLKRPHGRTHKLVMRWLDEYEEATLGTEAFDNTTVILGPDSEPQPDACLLIATEGLGQTTDEDDYIVGSPELAIEIASTMSTIDLHRKKDDYRAYGVKEYVVVVLKPARVFWFVLRKGRFRQLSPGADRILRSQVFPGLWLDPAALLKQDRRHLLRVLRQGLASTEHAAFVASLEQG